MGGTAGKFKYSGTNCNGAMNILKRALGCMSGAGAGQTQDKHRTNRGQTQPGTPCDVSEQMKEVPDAVGLRRENLPASAVESVNVAQLNQKRLSKAI